jgi:TonB family protein
MGIVVQFPQSFRPKLTVRERKYDPPSKDSIDHAALPISTIEPDYPLKTVAEPSVVLYNLINQQGEVTSTQVLRDVEPFTSATLAAIQKWQFVPGKEAGANTDSAMVVVVTFRHP